MGMGFAPTWLRQVSPPPSSHDHFNHLARARAAPSMLFEFEYSIAALYGVLDETGSVVYK